MLPHTDLTGAKALVEKLHAAVEDLNIPHSGSDFQHVTVSIGIAALDQNTANYEEMIKAADAHLYTAKKQGCNRSIA